MTPKRIKLKIKKALIPPFTRPLRNKSQLDQDLKKAYDKAAISQKKLIPFWSCLLLTITFITLGLIVIFLRKDFAWFKNNVNRSDAFGISFLVIGLIFLFFSFANFKILKNNQKARILQILNFEWWKKIINTNLKNTDLKIENVDRIAKVNPLLKHQIYLFNEDKLQTIRQITKKLFDKKITTSDLKPSPYSSKLPEGFKIVNDPNFYYIYQPQVNGTFKKRPFSFGTFIEVKIYSDGDQHKVIHKTAKHIISIDLDNDYNLRTKIEPELKFDFVAKLKARSEGLESTEFEKKYKLNYDQPIKLRRFLQPKVMNDILDECKKINFDPTFIIHDKRLTICFSNELDTRQKKAAFKGGYSSNYDAYRTLNLQKIKISLSLLKESLSLANIFI